MYDEKSLQGIGNKIKQLRTLHQVNQQQLAKQLGISQTHMSNIEAGRVSVNLRLLMRVANLFECKLDDIISGSFSIEEVEASAVQEESYSAEEVRLLLKILQVSKDK
ncbi:helix-turn-helix domain-containing protein [uncultured Phascolarctobacterium sp.]|uniref:helix-turn-helix transcriptional regulator n=1 Tax=uncultured Phascolarctobacterium sp. TaxID=512296 RepID=UPI0027D94D8F|nr:helix-turn-helix domain-containing protein [uncultured Phascolarctobacterium sp.]